MKNLAVLFSGGGSGFQAFIDAIETKQLTNATIAVAITNREQAGGVERAKKHDIPLEINKKKENLLPLLKKYAIDLFLLIGFSQIIPDDVIAEYKGRILNSHPGIIPDQKDRPIKNPDGTPALWNQGKFTDAAMQNVLDNHASYAGSSIHIVTNDVDFGPVLSRCFEKVKSGDTIDSLYRRLKQKEQAIYIETVQNLCNK